MYVAGVYHIRDYDKKKYLGIFTTHTFKNVFSIWELLNPHLYNPQTARIYFLSCPEWNKNTWHGMPCPPNTPIQAPRPWSRADQCWLRPSSFCLNNGQDGRVGVRNHHPAGCSEDKWWAPPPWDPSEGASCQPEGQQKIEVACSSFAITNKGRECIISSPSTIRDDHSPDHREDAIVPEGLGHIVSCRDKFNYPRKT